MSVTLHVCITCRAGQTLADDEIRPGARLHAAILEAGAPDGVDIVPVECLSACSQGCSVALSAPGRWSYVYGRLSEVNAPGDRGRGRSLCGGARRHRAMAHAPGDLPQAVARPHSTDHSPAGGRRMTSLAKIPVTVITGFLGSGKTTLIRHLLNNPDGKKLAVLVNEFGSEGVDGEILKSCADANCPEENIVELANGCICCTVADDFIPTIELLLSRRVRPDHILIETSGLALPKPLLKAFDWPEIRSRITVDGVIALADAEAVAAGRFAPDPAAVEAQRAADDSLDHETPLSEVFEDQICCADIVLLTKADLAGSEGLEAARAVISAEMTRPRPDAGGHRWRHRSAVDPRSRSLGRGRSRRAPLAS